MTDFLDIKGKHFLVTGASGGIGRSCCLLLSQFGASLTLTGRNSQELKKTAALCQGETLVIEADLSIPEGIDDVVNSLAQKIDGLIHCAGKVKPMPVKYIKTSHYEEVLDINLRSAILLTSSLLKGKMINPNSSFVFLSSISAQHPYLGGALYVASKAALESFVKTLALEHSKLLRANIISPALVKTNIFDETVSATGEEEMQQYETKYPLGFGTPEDIANACAFLVSSRSKWITGSTLVMDGGLLIGGKS